MTRGYIAPTNRRQEITRARTVLVAEDRGDIVEPLRLLLESEGFRALVAPDGAAALSLLHTHADVDAIVLDLMMPTMDGYEFRARQLADPALADIPTVVMTAGPIETRLSDLRAAACLEKPVDVPALMALLRRLTTAAPGHEAVFYDDEARLTARAVDHLAGALCAGGSAVMVTTGRHRTAILDGLAARDLDPIALQHRARLVSLDAVRARDAICVGRRPSARRFHRVAGDLVRHALAEATGPVHVYGELVDLLWQAGEVDAAVRVEQLWNGVRRRCRFPLLCGYRAASGEPRLAAVRAQHARCAAA